jgi:heterodisulfide reductase subunit B
MTERVVSYYPGCSLHGMSREYDASTRLVYGALGVDLRELAGWTCCGASAAHSLDPALAVGLAARNLELAEAEGDCLVAPCAACYHRLKVAEKGTSSRVTVLHALDVASSPETLGRLRDSLRRPLNGLKVVCYYGCLLVRPPELTGRADYEDPQSMDQVMSAAGADVRSWSFKTDCCGAGLAVARPDVVRRLSGRLVEMAREAGADCIVTACPLCQTNLDTRQGGASLPVMYFTELLACALGLEGTGSWWRRHMVNPVPVLAKAGVL